MNSILLRINPVTNFSLSPRQILLLFWSNNRFRNFRVRDSLQYEVDHVESWLAINPVCSGAACCCSDKRGAAAKEYPPDRISIWGSPNTNPARFQAFRDGLKALGYIDGKNIVVEWRFAEGNPGRYPGLVSELVRLKVNVIVTPGSTSTRAAKKGTTTIPIVMAQDPDPVGNGYVASLAHPGGNITGLSSYSAELNGKRVELLKEIVPKLSCVAVFGDSTFPGNTQALKDTEPAAAALAVKLQYLDVQAHKDTDSLFRAASKDCPDAVLVFGGPRLTIQRTELAHHAVKSRLPVIYPNLAFVQAGGLTSYGTSITDMFRRAATFVDKILKGRKPADLPVEQPIKFEFIVNLKAAKQIGLTIPPNVLVRANRVIK